MRRRVIALDTETTGFSPRDDRIVEIAAIDVIPRTGDVSRELHHFVNPQRGIPPDATRVHGITDGDLLNAPLFGHIAENLTRFISDSILVIHNSSFDVSMLNASLSRVGRPPLTETNVEVVDSVGIAKEILPLLPSYALDPICDYVGIAHAGRTLHGALLDARLLARTLPELASEYDAWRSLIENDCATEVAGFHDSLETIAEPYLARDEASATDVACDLGSVVTMARWLAKMEEKLRPLCESVVAQPGWTCKHLFARVGATDIFSYKAAVEGLLPGLDLSPYQSKSFVYRVAPTIDEPVQVRLNEKAALVSSDALARSVTSLIRAFVTVKRLKRIIEERRESLRRTFLGLTREGFKTDLVSVTESERRNTDYRQALEDLAPDADLTPFARSHVRLSVGERAPEQSGILFL